MLDPRCFARGCSPKALRPQTNLNFQTIQFLLGKLKFANIAILYSDTSSKAVAGLAPQGSGSLCRLPAPANMQLWPDLECFSAPFWSLEEMKEIGNHQTSHSTPPLKVPVRLFYVWSKRQRATMRTVELKQWGIHPSDLFSCG